MINKKYTALTALLALALFTGAIFSGCADNSAVSASSGAGNTTQIEGDDVSAPSDNGEPVPSGDIAKPSDSESIKEAGSSTKPAAPKQPPQQPSVSPSDTVKSDTDDSYFDDAVFIGDSLTEGFQLHGGLTNATYYGFKNLNVKEVFEKELVKTDGGKITIADALKKNSFGKYYIMLGANELGWVYPDVFISKYGNIIDLIRETNPDAKIYLQSVLPVSAETSEKSTIYSNSRINYYDELISALAADKNVTYLNVREAVQNESGILPDDAATDGVHLNKSYCLKWADYLREHK